MQVIDINFIVWIDGAHICAIFNQLLSIDI